MRGLATLPTLRTARRAELPEMPISAVRSDAHLRTLLHVARQMFQAEGRTPKKQDFAIGPLLGRGASITAGSHCREPSARDRLCLGHSDHCRPHHKRPSRHRWSQAPAEAYAFLDGIAQLFIEADHYIVRSPNQKVDLPAPVCFISGRGHRMHGCHLIAGAQKRPYDHVAIEHHLSAGQDLVVRPPTRPTCADYTHRRLHC